jgi:hypothetical protein
MKAHVLYVSVMFISYRVQVLNESCLPQLGVSTFVSAHSHHRERLGFQPADPIKKRSRQKRKILNHHALKSVVVFLHAALKIFRLGCSLHTCVSAHSLHPCKPIHFCYIFISFYCNLCLNKSING